MLVFICAKICANNPDFVRGHMNSSLISSRRAPGWGSTQRRWISCRRQVFLRYESSSILSKLGGEWYQALSRLYSWSSDRCQLSTAMIRMTSCWIWMKQVYREKKKKKKHLLALELSKDTFIHNMTNRGLGRLRIQSKAWFSTEKNSQNMSISMEGRAGSDSEYKV